MVDEKRVSRQIDSLVTRLQGQNNIREGKYITNYARYMYNGVRRDDLWTPYATSPNYWAPARGTTGVQTQFNLTKSVIDTVVSKISQANVRPYFNSINGDFDTRELCSALQKRFDAWLDQQHAYAKSVLAFRDACIFDVGVLFADPIRKQISRVPPWKYFLDPSEYEKDLVSQVCIWDKYWPIIAFKDTDNPKLKRMLDEDRTRQGKYARFWDLYRGEFYEQFEGEYIHDPEPLDYEQVNGLYVRPMVEIFYTKPVKGFLSRGLADDLYPIQRNIDNLIMRLDEAFRNGISAMGFVPGSVNVKPSLLENGYRIYPYDYVDGAPPITMVTPPAISDQFPRMLDNWIEKGYEIAGISQLSAQAKKPTGLDSGKALDTMEDIESDRFETQLDQFVHLNVELVQVCINVFPKSDAILENPLSDEKIRWGDARKERNAYRLQFSAADALSKDPEEKRNEIQFYLDQGLLDQGMIADMMELPDLEQAENLASASYKHCMRIISRAVKDGDFEFDEIVNLDDLLKYSTMQLNVLCANGDRQEYIDRLNELVNIVNDKRNQVAQYNQQPPQETEPLKDTGLDSGQIDALKNILADQTMLPGAKAAIITASFPKIDQALVSQMLAAPANGGQAQNV